MKKMDEKMNEKSTKSQYHKMRNYTGSLLELQFYSFGNVIRNYHNLYTMELCSVNGVVSYFNSRLFG